MRRAFAGLFAALVLGAGPASADIYRCVAADGSVSFVGDPSACASATRHEPDRDVQGVDPERSAPPAARAPVARRLEDRLPPATGLAGPGKWEVVKEVSLDPSRDADLVSWGVREKAARHYTHHDRAGKVRVCSVELWAFESEGHAAVALQNLAYPGWSFERRGDVLVMLRGVTRVRGQRAQRGVFPECRKLGARVAGPPPAGSR